MEEIDVFLKRGASIVDPGERISFISSLFLGKEYRESTLVGDETNDEIFVVNFEGLDCFTFIDYVEAMRLSTSFDEFKKSLKRIRYRRERISFRTRNHFFTDWIEFNSGFIYDATKDVGLSDAKSAGKVLNLKKDGTLFLPGIEPVQRNVNYIAAASLNESMLSRIKNGDYIGIYSDFEGLDVSHVGIFIAEDKRFALRHASSKKEIRKVVDQDFVEYVMNRPGIIVFRPRSDS